jgi:hypothetical protein
MRHQRWIAILATTWALSAATASAQEGAIIVDTPAPGSVRAPEAKMTYAEFRLQELEKSARRTGIAFGATTGAAVLGTALFFPGLVRQCFVVQMSDGSEELQCTPAGKALVGLGFPLWFGGLTGMLVSGIMYGVRRGKVRRLKEQIAYGSFRAIQWDPKAGVFRF